MTSGRRVTLPLLFSIAIAIALRLEAGVFRGCARGIELIQEAYREVALRIATGHGYTQISGDPLNEYYLPGYAYLLAPVEAVFGPSCAPAQAMNAVIDGAVGPALAFLLLAGLGTPVAGVLAAALYAVAPQLVHNTIRTAPDALAPVLTLAPGVALVWARRRDRPALGAFGAGLLIALGGAFRGEFVAMVPLMAVVAASASRSSRTRALLAAAVVGGWIVGTAPLAIFWQQQHGYLSVSRPGIGIRLWAGVHEVPFELEEPEAPAERLVAAQGMRYPSAEGDAFLLADALASIRAEPSAYAQMVVERAARLLGTWDGLPLLGAASIAIAARWSLFAAVLLAGLWLSRALPLSLIYHMHRDLVPIVAVTVVAVAYVTGRAFEGLRSPPAARAHAPFGGAAATYQTAVERSFDFIGRDLDFFAAEKAGLLGEAMRELLGDPATMSVLDVGCGIGTVGAHLSPTVKALHGVDVAEDIVAEAARRDPRGQYAVYDGRTIPHAAASFDVVYAVNVIHHVEPPDRSAFMAELVRVVRPGGLVAVIEHNPWNPLTQLAVQRCEFDATSELLGRSEVNDLLRAGGLAIARTRYILFVPWRGPGVARLERSLAWLPLGAQHMTVGRAPSISARSAVGA